MAGHAKQNALRGALDARAVREFGEGAQALDYVVSYLENGGMFSALAKSLEADLGEPVSRTIVSHVAHRLHPDAKERIRVARQAGAASLVEDAVGIVDDAPTDNREALQKARMRSDIRLWVAERQNPAEFGTRKAVDMSLSIGDLHLQALKHIAAQVAEGEPSDSSATTGSVSGHE